MGEVRDAKEIEKEIIDSIKESMKDLPGAKPRLDVIFAYEKEYPDRYAPSESYINALKSRGKKLGIQVVYHKYENPSVDEIKMSIEYLAQKKEVNGILLLVPAPIEIMKNLSSKILGKIPKIKDVDGMGRENIGGILQKFHPEDIGDVMEMLIPATSKAVLYILSKRKKGLKGLSGKEVLLIGHSRFISGALYHTLRDIMTQVLAFDKSMGLPKSKGAESIRRLKKHTKDVDIIVSGSGKPFPAGKDYLITSDMVKKGQIIIDAGMWSDEDGKLHGSVDIEKVKEKIKWIMPPAGGIEGVKAGVGDVTAAMLFKNTVIAYKLQKDRISEIIDELKIK